MDAKILAGVCTQVYQQVPAVNGASPKVQEKAGGLYQVSFRTKKSTIDGKSLPMSVRVTCDSQGKILKIAQSH